MVKNPVCAILTVIIVLFCTPANAALMDFESLPGGPLTLPYTEDGIRMVSSTEPTNVFAYADGHQVVHVDGGTILFDMFGIAFDLTAIDFDLVGLPETALEVTASNGFMVTLPPSDGQLGTIFFNSYPQFSSITSFEVYDPTLANPAYQFGACVEFDWIGTNGDLGPVNVIPEPSTLLLLGTGLLGVARIALRRKS